MKQGMLSATEGARRLHSQACKLTHGPMIKEMIKATKCSQLEDTRLYSTVFEDNQGAYYLATNQRITSRTRYLLSHWHWFWDMVNQKDEDGNPIINLVKCPTDEMQSDYLTKPLGKILFANNRITRVSAETRKKRSAGLKISNHRSNTI